jgi:arylsulfatase A-like enzyme
LTRSRLTCALVVCLLSSSATADRSEATKKIAKPNILLIFSDDQGYASLGCHGLTDIPTPNIDSIAEGGTRFTDGYVTAPVCSPSRAGLITGRYQQRFGHEHNPGASTEVGLPLSERTIADHLREAGYATGIVGKWHLGMSSKHHPMSRGFGEFFGFLHGAHDYFKPTRGSRVDDPITRNRKVVAETRYLTDALGEEAADFIRRHRKEPWFLYLAFNAVHTPLQATEADRKRFANIEDPNRRSFAAMLFAMDRAVGRVLAEVKRQGLTNRTLIFFISDNGGPTRQTTSRNVPYRGNKGDLYEGGIRVPWLVRWDGRLPGGKVVNTPVSTLDVLPTALAAAGVEVKKDSGLDGVNLIPLLAGDGKAAPSRTLFWRRGKSYALRDGDMKLVGLRKRVELFDLAADPGEKRNLARARPETVQRLKKLFAEWEKGTVPAAWGKNPPPRGK